MPTASEIAARRDALLARVPDANDLWFMIPQHLRGKPVLTVSEAAQVMRYDRRTVLDELQNARFSGEASLEHYGPPGRIRSEWRITMRGVIQWLLQNWHGHHPERTALVKEYARHLDRSQCVELAKFFSEEATRKPLK